MFKYAELNNENIVIAISRLSGEIIADNMILISDLEVELDSSYNRDTGEFTAPEPQPEPTPIPTIEEKILAENQYQTMLLELNTLGGM